MNENPQTGDDKLKNLAESLSEELGGNANVKKHTPPTEEGATIVQVTPTETPAAEAPPPVSAPTESPPASTESASDPTQTATAAATEAAAAPTPTPTTAEAGTTTPPVGAQAQPVAEAQPQTPAQTSTNTPEPEVLSIDDLDKILNEQDPLFAQNMAELKKSLSQPLNVRGANIDEKDLGIVDKEDTPKRAAMKASFGKRFAEAVTKKTTNAIDGIVDLAVKSAAQISKTVGKVRPWLQILTEEIKQSFLALRSWISARTTLQKINLLLFCIVSVLLVIVVGRILTGKPILSPAESPFLRSFEQVADRIETLSEDEPMEQFDSPLRNPEYVVLFKKMFVNLKPMGNSRNPMAAFEIYVEANSQEAAVELKDRERQFRDVIARIFEAMPYDEIATAEGKNKLKLIIRRDLNQVLNKGRVKKVYFKTFFYKS